MILLMEEVSLRFHLNIYNKYFQNTYLDEFLDQRHFRNVAEDNVLRVVLKHSESIRNPARVSIFLSLQELIKLFKLATRSELHVARSFSHKFIAGSDISFYDFLQVLEKLLVSDLKL
jgi:hypothetical protein